MEALNTSSDDGIKIVQALYEIRCADSRDRGIVEGKIADFILSLYSHVGIEVIRNSFIGAGVFATADMINALRRGIHKDITVQFAERGNIWPFRGSAPAGNVPFEVVVQVNTHADVSPAGGVPEGKVVYGKNELVIAEHSSINCGMGQALDVYKELMDFLISKRLSVQTDSGLIVINDDDSLLELLQRRYGFEGENPDEFIRPISDHNRHVTKQARKIRTALEEDFQLRDLNFAVNAGITNYRTGRIYRIDGNEFVCTAMDDIAALTAEILALLPDGHAEKKKRVEKQEPKALLLCPPTVSHPRNKLVWYLNAAVGPMGTPGSVFAISGYDVVGATYPFGPYRLLSIFYAIKHLGIKDLYIIGENDGDVAAMSVKISRDPIVSLIIKEFGVNVHRMTQNELGNKSRDSIPPQDRILDEAIREGRAVFMRKLADKERHSPLVSLPADKLKRLGRPSIPA